MRIEFGKTSLLSMLLTLFLLLCFNCIDQKKTVHEYNVVLIVIDTLRKDHLPMYGYDKNTAPFLSEIASKGAVFDHVFSPSSWTAPATASILTSLYPFQHGVLRGFIVSQKMLETDPGIKLQQIPENVQTIPEFFKKQGYQTYGVSDNINISKAQNFDQGFDYFKLFKDQGAEAVNSQIYQWKQKIQSGGKYFLYIHYNDPHKLYKKRSPWYKRKDDFLEDEVSAYDSEINYLDHHLKTMSADFAWDKNTLIIVSSDHGEEFFEHGGAGHGSTLFGEVINVPLIFYFPPTSIYHKNSRIIANVSTIDILPTLRDFFGTAPGSQDEGISLLPFIRGNTGIKERYIFSHLQMPFLIKTKGILRVSIHENLKLIFSSKGAAGLYDIYTDPLDSNNFYGSERKAGVQLLRKFIDFRRTCKKFMAGEKD